MLVTAVFAIFYGMNLYLVTYDSLQEFCSTVLHRRVADSFKQWWHYAERKAHGFSRGSMSTGHHVYRGG